MDLDQDLELIAAVLLVVGLLPFAMAWLERSLTEPRPTRGSDRRRP